MGDRTTVMLRLRKALVIDGETLAIIAGRVHLTDDWGHEPGHQESDDDWNQPFDDEDLYRYLAPELEDRRPEAHADVEWVRVLVRDAGGWDIHRFDEAVTGLAVVGEGSDRKLLMTCESGRWLAWPFAGGRGDPETGEYEFGVNELCTLGRELYALSPDAVMRRDSDGRWSEVLRLRGLRHSLRCMAVRGPDEIYVGGAGEVLWRWDGRAATAHTIDRARGYFTRLACSEGGIVGGTTAGDIIEATEDGFAVSHNLGMPIRAVRPFRGDLYAAVGPIRPWYSAAQRAAGQLWRRTVGFEPVAAEGLEVAGDRLWVVGPHHVLSTTDGSTFAPLIFRA
jgi:hypothetical protein